jgi:hypothetical protein
MPGSALATTPFPGLQPAVARVARRPQGGRGVPPLNHFLSGLLHLAEGYEDHHLNTVWSNVPLRNLAGCHEATWSMTLIR